MEKLVAADPVGAFHGLIKHTLDADEATSLVRRAYNKERLFRYQPAPHYPTDFLEHRFRCRERCSFCKKPGHVISGCRFLASAKCSYCGARGHRASHCAADVVPDLAANTVWRPLLLQLAFTKAVITEDLKWLDQVLEYGFVMRKKELQIVMAIQSPSFRNQVLWRIFDWMEPASASAFMRLLHLELNKCISWLPAEHRMFRRHIVRHVSEYCGKINPRQCMYVDYCAFRSTSRRFIPGTPLESRAKDLRYMYAFGLLQGAETRELPNYSFLKAAGKVCRRQVASGFADTGLIKDIVLLVASYLYF